MGSPLRPARHPRTARLLARVLTFTTLVLLSTAAWIRYRFGAVSLEQIISNLPTAGGGEVGNGSLVVEAASACLGLPALLLLAGSLALRIRRRRAPSAPAPDGRGRRLVGVPALAFAVSLTVLLVVAGIPQYASAMLADRSMAPYYLAPDVIDTPREPKNLVTIYLESGENTFANADLLGQNLISELDDATRSWARFDGLQQYPGGGWTMAGLVGTQCGVPLKSRLLVNGVNPNDFGEQVQSFLPGAHCLGDILADHGYTNVFLGGAHSRFAGKDTFLSGHGYDRVLGLSEWEAAGEDRSNISVWGLSDQRLFEHARDTIEELREAGEPFNLTILTLDTHEPAAVYPTCTTTDDVPMATAWKCSMHAVAGFLAFLSEHGYLKDTVVQVMGDHLKDTSEGGYFKDELRRTPERTIIYRVWSPDPVDFHRESADQLSVLPTTLDLLGFRLRGGQGGLGVSLLRPYALADTAVALPADDYHAVVTSASAGLYRELWQEPE